MAMYKCKMCGGALDVQEADMATCQFCGTRQTLPKPEQENHLRLDKALDLCEQILSQDGGNQETLLRRAYLFLEDGDWRSANEYCERVLDIDPHCPEAYLAKLMAECRVKQAEDLKDCSRPFDGSIHYQKLLRFGDPALTSTISAYVEHIKTRNEQEYLQKTYQRAQNILASARSEGAYMSAARVLESIPGYADADMLARECHEKAQIAKKDAILDSGKAKMSRSTLLSYEAAIRQFETIPGWKDADQLAALCQKNVLRLRAQDQAARLARKRQAEFDRAEMKKTLILTLKIAVIATLAVGLLAGLAAGCMMLFVILQRL